MTITYDSEGRCTRCGSTGYYLGSYTSDSSFEDTRTCVKPCPCHGWRPIEEAPREVAWVPVWHAKYKIPCVAYWDAHPGEWCWYHSELPCDPQPTHYHPQPVPPEFGEYHV